MPMPAASIDAKRFERLSCSGGNDMTAKIPGHALQDNDARVRRVAAEALGEIGTPAGILYLTAYTSYMSFAPDAPASVVDEYNAARLALASLTSFDDVEPGAKRWIPVEGLEASRARWKAWLSSPPGVEALKKSIHDLVRTGEPHPEFYLIVQVFSDAPEVATTAHQALVERSTQPSTDPVAQKMWPTFPRSRTEADGKKLTAAESLEDLRTRVMTWWKAWRALREAQPK